MLCWQVFGESDTSEHPKFVSSTKDWPRWETETDWSTDVWWRQGTLAGMNIDIKMKQRIHRKGPRVAPWPGPKRRELASFEWPSVEIPYTVWMWWTVDSQDLAKEETIVLDTPRCSRKSSTRRFTILSKQLAASFSIDTAVSFVNLMWSKTSCLFSTANWHSLPDHDPYYISGVVIF